MSVLAAIILTGLAISDPVPGAYLEVNFAQGEAAGSGSATEVVLIGNKLSTGSAVVDTEVYGPDTLVQLQTEADAISLFGAGSELHRMFRRFTRINKDTTLRAIAVTESAGAAATATCVISTAATGNGNIRVYAYDEFVDVAIASGDAVDTIGAAVVSAVNQMTHWGFTTSYNTGTDTVTFTAKQKGPRGNQIRIQLAITSGIGTSLSALTTDTAFSGGTTEDSYTTALGTLATAKYYYQVSASSESTKLGALVTQINTLAAPTTGNRQRVIAGSVETLANATTLATGRNAARCEIVWSEKSPLPESEIAAHQAAIVTLFEVRPNPRTNWCNFGQDAQTSAYWQLPASRVKSAWPSRTSIKSALNNGLSPVGVNTNGSTYLVNRITTRSLNGSVNDYRIRAAHKVSLCDFFGEDLVAKTVLQFSGKRIADDPVQGQRPPGPQVVTPTIYKGAIFTLLTEYDGNDLIDNLAAVKAGTIVQRETSPRTRISARIPFRPIDNAEQFAIALDQVA